MRSVLTHILAIFGLVFIGLLIYSKFSVKSKNWNKETGIDVHQEFTKAYLTDLNGKTQIFTISSWRDFDNGDQLQFTTTDGVTYLTHSSRIVLTDEK